MYVVDRIVYPDLEKMESVSSDSNLAFHKVVTPQMSWDATTIMLARDDKTCSSTHLQHIMLKKAVVDNLLLLMLTLSEMHKCM